MKTSETSYAEPAAGRPAETGGDPGTTIEERSPDGRGAVAPWPGFFSGVLSLLRPKAPSMLREEIAEALLKGTGDGVFSAEERTMLTNILGLREVRVEDVMVPRSEIDAVEIGVSLGELMHLFEESGHSRMPVYGESLDDPLGMIHIRDVVAYLTRVAQPADADAEQGQRPILDLARVDLGRGIEDLGLVRKVLFVPPSMLASNLMARMKATRTQMALVIDEYGGTDGLVSLEDIIEKVVGDIEDEHDAEETLITARGEGVYVADAKADLYELRALVGLDFDVSPYVEEADTIGGLLFAELGRVPREGEVVSAVPGFEIHVVEADARRVLHVKIVRLTQGEPRLLTAEAAHSS